MKLFLSLVIVPLLASPWAAATAGCNADNCLRALRNPTRSAAATSFCHSYTQANVTATTSLPAQFATACGSGPTQSSRLSSACSCYVVSPVLFFLWDRVERSLIYLMVSETWLIYLGDGQPAPSSACGDTSSDSNNCGACGNVVSSKRLPCLHHNYSQKPSASPVQPAHQAPVFAPTLARLLATGHART